MLLPQVKLRTLWLRRALRDYPIYDPPHKVEERLLPREKAADNFAYFMSMRQQRVADFKDWLRRNFGVSVTPDEHGIWALNRWGNKYAGLLLVIGPDGHPTDTYFNYAPPWTAENAGHNALFDVGITFGEILIVHCPELSWDFDPLSAHLPNTARKLKREPGMSFQRPMLARLGYPVFHLSPLHNIYTYASSRRGLMSFKGLERLYDQPRFFRQLEQNHLLNSFRTILREYSAPTDPYDMRGQMAPKEYLKFIDTAEVDEEDDGHERRQ